MHVTAIKTKPITVDDTNILSILDEFLPPLKEGSVVAITSKIVAICEGRVVKISPEVNKDELIKKEAEQYLPRESNKFNFFVTVKNNTLIASAGIDESNGNGYYVLWPSDSQKSANQIREHLVKKNNIKHLGVIITDSKITPMRRGVVGVSLAHSGFRPLNDYIGEPDIFGHNLQYTKVNNAEALATSAVLLMGEGKECTPIAVIEDVPFLSFQTRNPSIQELEELKIPMEEDLYAGVLTSTKWEKGGK